MAEKEQYFIVGLDRIERVKVTELSVDGTKLLKLDIPEVGVQYIEPSQLCDTGIMTKEEAKDFLKKEISSFKEHMKTKKEMDKTILKQMQKLLREIGKRNV